MAGGACGGTIVDGPMPPSAVRGGAVWVAGALAPCVTTRLAWLVTMGGGNWLMTVCMTMLGPLAKLWVTGCDVDMGPLAKVRPKNGSGFSLAMGRSEERRVGKE